MKRFVDVSYHGSHYDISHEEYLKKSYPNVLYSYYLKEKYKMIFIFHSSNKGKIKKKDITFYFRKKKVNSKFLLPFRLFFLIKKKNPDIILSHSIRYIHFTALLRLFLPKKVVILIQHHGESPPFSTGKRALIRYCDKFIDGYFTKLSGANKNIIFIHFPLVFFCNNKHIQL